MDYFLPFKKYATFSGRANRREYWMFVLMFQFAPALVFFILFIQNVGSGIKTGSFETVLPLFSFLMLYWILIFLPSLAVGVRRLHDTDKSGWWMLISFIPFGSLVLLVFFLLPSSPVRNKYDSETPTIDTQATMQTETTFPNGIDKGLLNYIQKSKEAGKTEEEIKATLIANSWPEASINQALESLKGRIISDTVSSNS